MMMLLLLFVTLSFASDDLSYAVVADNRVDIITYYYPRVIGCSVCNVTEDQRIVYIGDAQWKRLNLTVELWEADGTLRETKTLEVERMNPVATIVGRSPFRLYYLSLLALIAFAVGVYVALNRPAKAEKSAKYQSDKQKDVELGKKMEIYE
jgi:hypothetical protein